MERVHSERDSFHQSLEPWRDRRLVSAEQDAPLWVPYVAQPRTRRARLVHILRRHAFAGVCVVLAALFIGAFVFLVHPAPAPRAFPEGLPSATRSSAPFSGATALSITSRPSGAAVLLDREPIGVTPLRRPDFPAGVHLLTVVKEGYAPYDSVVVLRGDTRRVVHVALRSTRASPSAPVPDASAGAQEVGYVEPQALQPPHPVPVESLVKEKTRRLFEALQEEKRPGSAHW